MPAPSVFPLLRLPTTCAALLGLGLMLAACQTAAQSDAVVAVAFDGFAAEVPAPVGQRLTAALWEAAGAQRLQMVPPGAGAPAALSLRAHLAPEPSGTAMAYVFDLFDAEGRRGRVAGTVALVAGADPWAELAGGAADRLARQGADGLAVFAHRASQARSPGGDADAVAGRPPDGPAPSPDSAPAPVSDPAGAAGLPVTTAALGPAPAAASPPPAGGRRIALGAVAVSEAGLDGALRASARQGLAALGHAVVEGGSADITLAAEGTLNPAERGQHRLAIVWRVSDGRGRALGEVRQMTRVSEAEARRPESLARSAVERALPGLAALVTPRP